MLLKTLLKRLTVQPETVRHDSYDEKDILRFTQLSGYTPYLEFQSHPKDSEQQIYFDVLNWESYKSQSELSINVRDYMLITKITPSSQLVTLSSLNSRLDKFYSLSSQ